MKKVLKKLVLSFTFLILLTVIPITAYNGWGYYRSPLMYLDNEWVMFSIIMLVFFAIIFYTVNKSFRNNIVSGVIALSLSLLISLTILRRGLLYGYAGEELGSWILIAVVLIAFGFLIKFAYEAFSYVGSIGTVFVIWLLLQRSDPYSFLPYGVSDAIVGVYEFFQSFLGLIVLILLAIIAAPFLEGKSPLQKTIEKIMKKLKIT